MPPHLPATFGSTVRDSRGVALPLALLSLLILSTMVIGFAGLAATEPLIASNQLRVAQARAAAEAGLERAAWALGHPADANGLPAPLPDPVPAPYDGSRLLELPVRGTAVAGFRVTVAPGAGPAERLVVVTGWSPSDLALARARQRITATLVKLRFPDPPAAVTTGGALGLAGSVGVDARADTSCGPRAGAWSAYTASAEAPVEVWGADGNATANEPTDIVEGGLPADLARHALTEDDLAVMRAYARSHGTYYRGRVTFGRGNPMPNGLVFVDSPSATPVSDTTADADMAWVDVEDAAALDPSGVKGWLVVNGTLRITGDFRLRGLVYAQAELVHAGAGHITGAVMSRNARAGHGTRIDPAGGAAILYDCRVARTGDGVVPETWSIKPGSYREIPG